LDPRVLKLCQLVKLWGKRRKVSGGSQGRISSYAYNLMVIFYLQKIANPPVIPSLQKLMRDPNFEDFKQGKYIPVKRIVKNVVDEFNANIGFVNDEARIQEYMAKNMKVNSQSTLELLIGFFSFYGEKYVDENLETISVKEADFVKRTEKEDVYLFSIEDPFDIHHNPGDKISKNSSSDITKLTAAIGEMRAAVENLKNKNMEEVFGIGTKLVKVSLPPFQTRILSQATGATLENAILEARNR